MGCRVKWLEIAEGTCGSLVAPGDLSAMADRVLEIITRQLDAPAKLLGGVVFHDKFDIDTMVQQQMQLYGDLLKACGN